MAAPQPTRASPAAERGHGVAPSIRSDSRLQVRRRLPSRSDPGSSAPRTRVVPPRPRVSRSRPDAQSNVTILGLVQRDRRPGSREPRGPAYSERVSPAPRPIRKDAVQHAVHEHRPRFAQRARPRRHARRVISTIAVSADSTTDFGNGPGLANPLSIDLRPRRVRREREGPLPETVRRPVGPRRNRQHPKLATNSSVPRAMGASGRASGRFRDRFQALTMGITSSGAYARGRR